jgi:hypothetical protein
MEIHGLKGDHFNRVEQRAIVCFTRDGSTAPDLYKHCRSLSRSITLIAGHYRWCRLRKVGGFSRNSAVRERLNGTTPQPAACKAISHKVYFTCLLAWPTLRPCRRGQYFHLKNLLSFSLTTLRLVSDDSSRNKSV